MKPSALFEALHALIGQRVPLHIWGACGVGKSQIVAQVAQDLNWQFLDIRAVQLDPVDLVAFLRLFRQLPSIPEILLNPDTAPVPDEPLARIAIATALGRVLTDHSIGKGMRYLERMPTELRVLAMRDAAARDRAITHTLEFVRFGVEHSEVLQ
jgi:MoxR-like ATPase